jgi:hypothetical protein
MEESEVETPEARKQREANSKAKAFNAETRRARTKSRQAVNSLDIVGGSDV